MSQYHGIVTDQVQPTLARHTGVQYQSLPQPQEHALALAAAVLGLSALPGTHRPRRHPRPGGTRIVRIEPAS